MKHLFNDDNDFFGALIGALVGGFFVLIGTWWTHYLDKSAKEKEASEHMQGMIQALHDEVEILWDSYATETSSYFDNLKEGQAIEMFYPISNDYFTIYNSNAVFIGKIKNEDLRKKIVSVYTEARGIIDSFRLNNDLLQKYEYIVELNNQAPSGAHQAIIAVRYEGLVQYAASLKKSHIELEAIVIEFLQAAKKEIDLLKAINNPAKLCCRIRQ